MTKSNGFDKIVSVDAIKKQKRKFKKVLTKVPPSDNIYLADAGKTKQQNKKSFKKVLTKQKRFDIIFIADAKCDSKEP